VAGELAFKSCDVKREERPDIVLPKGMGLPEAVTWLQRKQQEEEQETQFSELFDLDPWDGAVLLFNTLRDRFGFVSQTEIPPQDFFDPGQKPAVLTVRTGPTTEVKVPWGRFLLPGVEGFVQTDATRKVENGPYFFRFVGIVRKKSLPAVQEIIDQMHARMRAGESIYRGKAITNDKEFLDLNKVTPSDLILPKDIESQVAMSLFAPILYTDIVRSKKVPLKRGVLLTGPFGVGKSLTANVTAKLCEENGWTFILVKNVGQFLNALSFAKRYQPAVVFTEDIDELVKGERSAGLNQILEQIDGVVAKGSEIMVVLTTNSVEKIHPAMLRPGRLDAIVEFTKPDADAAMRLVKRYAGDQLADDVDLEAVGRACEGMIPATIAEVGARAKLAAIYRLGQEAVGKRLKLTTADLVTAARQLQHHQKMIEDRKEDPVGELKNAATKLRPIMGLMLDAEEAEVVESN